MDAQYEAILYDKLGPQLDAAIAGAKPGQEKLVVISGTGHGDNARGIAACQGLRAQYGRKVHITLVATWTNTMVEPDMVADVLQMGVIDAGICLPIVPTEALVAFCRDRADCCINVRPYAAIFHYNCGPDRKDLRAQLRKQAIADQRLKPHWFIASAHPLENWRLKFCPMSQWDILTDTLGVPVTEADLFAPMECCEQTDAYPKPAIGGYTGMQRAMKGIKDTLYVVMHNSAGPGGGVKIAPPAVFNAMLAGLKALGVACVQVGHPGDPGIEGAIDKRGFRLPLTNHILNGSLALISSEGFLPFMAAALDKPSLVLFGPTMPHTFAMRTDGRFRIPNHNIINSVTRDDGKVGHSCPAGTCFWGGGRPHPGFRQEKWASACGWTGVRDVDGNEINTKLPYCMNFVSPLKAVEESQRYIAAVLADKLGVEAVA